MRNYMEIPLKGCPFCRGPAMLYQASEWPDEKWGVTCDSDVLDCRAFQNFFPTTEDAAAAWNRRGGRRS